MILKNLLLALLTFALAASLVLNYFFHQKTFIPLQLAKLDPIGLNYYNSTPIQETTEAKPSIMFYGDSRALSWAPYKTTDYHFINRAIGNQTSTQILARFDAHVIPHKPQLILVQMCVNDLKMIPLFPNRRTSIIKDCLKNTQALIDKAQKIGAKVILTTVFPLGDVSIIRKALGTQEAPIIDGIEQVNDFITAQASDNVLVFDSYALLVGDNRKIKANYSRDWLHLNSEGYKRLNTHLKQFIEQTMSKDQ